MLIQFRISKYKKILSNKKLWTIKINFIYLQLFSKTNLKNEVNKAIKVLYQNTFYLPFPKIIKKNSFY